MSSSLVRYDAEGRQIGSRVITRDQPLTLRLTRFVVGGPTTGKTTLAARLQKRGAALLDTDEIIARYMPWWFDRVKKGIRPIPGEQRRLEAFIAKELVGALAVQPELLIFTNLWGRVLRDSLPSSLLFGESRFPIGVFRTRAIDIVALTEQRGSPLPLAMVEKWVVSFTKYAPTMFRRVIWLDAEDYLSDVIRCDYSWLLSAAGSTIEPDAFAELPDPGEEGSVNG